MRSLGLWLMVSALAGCAPAVDNGGDGGPVDGGLPDGGTTDGGTTDGGLSDGGTTDGGTDGGSTSAGQVVYINEFMADNARGVQAKSGAYADWIELYNAGDVDISLDGWFITDDLETPDKHLLEDLTVPAGGFLLLYAVDDTALGAASLSFALDAAGEMLGLYDPTGQPVDLLRFGDQLEDVSAARQTDGSATWVMGWPSTPAASNGAGTPDPDDAAAVEVVPASIWDDSELFSEDVLPHFELELSDASFDALIASPYEWVSGALIYDGERYEPVGVRTKGENSWQPITAKPSLKIKLDEYDEGPQHLLGLTELTLQNMDNDYTMMHERVAYRLYRDVGVPASRATHATLTLNGDSYGLYTHLETVDQAMIGRWFEDSGGSMFEQWDVDFYDRYVAQFELEFGDDDRTNLQGVADAMELASASAAVAAADAHLSWAGFQAYWAVGAVVGQFDAYPYSSPGDDCHVYDDPTTGVLHYLPHGMDEAFYYPTSNVETGAYGVLATTCRQDSACRDAWVEAVNGALDEAEASALLTYAEGVQAQIADLVVADSRKPYSTATVISQQASMLSFISGRRSELARQIGSTP